MYWVLCAVLIVFGLLGAASIGLPILVFLPFSCHGVDSADPNTASREWCTSLGGIEYAGAQGTAPAAWIALGSLAVGAVGYLSASRALRSSVSS